MKEIKQYYKNGQIREHYWINENNKVEGEYKYWHSNGQIWEHCFYSNDKPVGEYKNWYEDGKLFKHCFYHNDKEIDIAHYVTDMNNITEEEYFHLQLVYGYFPIIKYVGTIQ